MTNRERINKMSNKELTEFLFVCQKFSFLTEMIKNHTIEEWFNKEYNAHEFLRLGLDSTF